MTFRMPVTKVKNGGYDVKSRGCIIAISKRGALEPVGLRASNIQPPRANVFTTAIG